MKQPIRSTPRGCEVAELLEIYQGTLDTIRDLPLVPMVLWRHGGRRGWVVLHYLPRPRWLLRYFVVRHIDRVLASLSRRYSGRAALGSRDDTERQDREAVQEFRQSLPPPRVRTYLTLLVVTTLVLGRAVIDRIVTQVLQLTAEDLGGSELRREVRETFEILAGALSVDFGSVNSAVNALLNEGLREVAVVAFGLALSLYVVLRPFVPAFRLKRMLFNLAPDPAGRRGSAVARWSVSQATGVYERERRLFEGLGGRAPREFPFDLVVPALAMLLPLVWGGLLARLGARASLPTDRLLFFAGTCFMWVLALVRLGWLYRTWQRRQPGRAGPYMPYEVRIHGGRAVAKVERPLGVRLLLFLLLFLFGLFGVDPEIEFSLLGNVRSAFGFALVGAVPISLLWWFRIRRELRDLDRSYATATSGRRSVPWYLVVVAILLVPLLTVTQITIGGFTLDLFYIVIAAGLLIPPLLLVVAGSRIRRAQARAGIQGSLRFVWLLAPAVLLHPFAVAYLQRELNKVWAVEGEPLDPWFADAPKDAKPSPDALPWLRGMPANSPSRPAADV